MDQLPAFEAFRKIRTILCYILHFLIMTPYPIVILTKFCVHGMPDVRALVCLHVIPSQWIDRKVCFTGGKAAGSRS